MRIEIAGRLQPFSHTPGICCLLPGTCFEVEVFPMRLCVYDLRGTSRKKVQEHVFSLVGPIEDFTVLQDLEKGCLTVFGQRLPRFHILPDLQRVTTKNAPLSPRIPQERLSLGMHKKQEWEGMKKRGDFREIFPLWLRLGSMLDLPVSPLPSKGMFSLIEKCREKIQEGRPEHTLNAFKNLFLAGFRSLLVPRLLDDKYQGIVVDESVDISALYLLKESALLIRSLFIEQKGETIRLLPHLPPEFFAGRMIQVDAPALGTLDLEWSKKKVRRVILRAERDGFIHLEFPPGPRSFRLRERPKEKGRIIFCGDQLEIKSGSFYLLDQFKN